EVSDAVRAHVARTGLTPGSWAGDPARASRAPAREQLVALGSAALALVARVARRAQGAGPAMAAPPRGGHQRWGRLASAKGVVLAAALAAAGRAPPRRPDAATDDEPAHDDAAAHHHAASTRGHAGWNARRTRLSGRAGEACATAGFPGRGPRTR